MPQIIEPMERIAQLIIIPHENVNFNEMDYLDNTERGEGGFGSMGKWNWKTSIKYIMLAAYNGDIIYSIFDVYCLGLKYCKEIR